MQEKGFVFQKTNEEQMARRRGQDWQFGGLEQGEGDEF
jgi:hypothetical protein